MNMYLVNVTAAPVIDLKATGRNIKNLRKKAGMSVKDLQAVMGFTNPQAIYKWQNGSSLPSIDNFVLLSAALNTSIDDILVIDDLADEEQEVHHEQFRLLLQAS